MRFNFKTKLLEYEKRLWFENAFSHAYCALSTSIFSLLEMNERDREREMEMEREREKQRINKNKFCFFRKEKFHSFTKRTFFYVFIEMNRK